MEKDNENDNEEILTTRTGRIKRLRHYVER